MSATHALKFQAKRNESAKPAKLNNKFARK